MLIVLITGCSDSKHSKIEYFDTGEIKSEIIYDNKRDTTSFYINHFYKNGSIRLKEEFFKSKREGVYTSYYQNGNIDEVGIFKNGLKHGIFSKYNEQGFLAFSNYYYNNKMILRKETHFIKENKKFRHIFYMLKDTNLLSFVGYIDYDTLGNVLENESSFYDVVSLDSIKQIMKIKIYNKQGKVLMRFQEKIFNELIKAEIFEQKYDTYNDTLTVHYMAKDIVVGDILLVQDTISLKLPFYQIVSTKKENPVGIEPYCIDSILTE
ncbi:MAG TPA: hypothetical protein PKM28_06265 [Tenuifilaceae bacterium]|nr:hypothetical protein [Tenuifilaceae bacterium]